MRALFVSLFLLICCCFLVVAPAGASTHSGAAAVTAASSSSPSMGTYDPYLGKGDLLTRAVPACCCSSGDIVCEEMPQGTHCKQFSLCVCNAFHLCRLP